jgi:hypothetical protein
MKQALFLLAVLIAPLAALHASSAPAAETKPPIPTTTPIGRKDTPAQPPKNTGAQVGRDASGRPVLLVDGLPEALNPGVLLWDRPAFAQVFAKAELEQLVVWLHLSNIRTEQPHIKQENHLPVFWRGLNDYEPAMVNRLLGPILAAHPRAKLILWLDIHPYRSFTGEHPDAVIRNDRGDSAVALSHFLRFEPADSKSPLKGNEYHPVSFFSEAYRSEAGEMLEAFIRAVEASPAKEAVIGYLIGGGQDCQQYAYAPPNRALASTPVNWGDYSPAARRAFPGWLQRRYGGDVAALNRSWQSALSSFADATPPPAADLAGPPAFHNPLREMRAYDWKRFLAEGRSEFIIAMADRIRSAATRRVIVGTSGGDSGSRRDNTATGLLLRAKSLDFYLHQASYGVRIPPSAGGINAVLDSYGANGKLFLADIDHRLWTKERSSGDSRLSAHVTFNDDTVGHARDMAMQRDMWRREYARLWVAGNHGAWHMSFAKPADYDHTEILTEIRFLHERMRAAVSRNAKTTRAGGDAEVAFVFDEAAVDFARSALSEFHAAGMSHQWRESHASGVPIRYYYAQDLRDGLIPPAKLYVLQNLLHIDEVMAGQIRKMRESGATIVLLQGTGMAQLRTGQSGFLDETLGIKLRLMDTFDKDARKPAPAQIDSPHPLLGGDRWNPASSALDTPLIKEVEGISLAVDDPRASILATYPKSGLPAAAAIEETNGGKVVFVGAYNLSRDVISRLAAYAGAWRVAPPGNVIAADGEVLMIHPLKDGNVEVAPKTAAALRQLPPGDIASRKATKHTLNLKAGNTYLFEVTQ